MKSQSFILYCLFLILPLFKVNGQMITVDMGITYQTIGHWENGGYLPTGLEKYITEDLVDLTVDSLGINRLRLEIRSGSENPSDFYQLYQDSLVDYDTWRSMRYATVNDNEDPDSINWDGFHFTEMDQRIESLVIPIRNRLLNNGTDLYINLCIVAFTGQLNGGSGGMIVHQDPEEYAEFVEAIFLHMENKYGFVPNAVEVILEPDVAKFGNGVLVGECMVAAGERLDKMNYHPDFIACSNTNLFNALGRWYTELTSVPGVSDYWSEYSFHAYAGRTDDNLIQIATNAKLNNVTSSMLEWWNNGHRFDYLHKCLKLANNSSYQFKGSFGTVDNDWNNGLLQIKDNGNNNYSLDLQPPVKYFRHYFGLIRPGAVRFYVESDTSFIDPIGFMNTDGHVVINLFTSSAGEAKIQGLPEGKYKVICSLGDGRKEPSPYWKTKGEFEVIAGEPLDISILSEGVYSIVQTSGLTTNTKVGSTAELDFDVYTDHQDIYIFGKADKQIDQISVYTLQGALWFDDIYEGKEVVKINKTQWTDGYYIILINGVHSQKILIR